MHFDDLHTSSPTMIRPLSLAQHTLYADLLEQGSDDLFDPDLPENGSIIVRGNRAGAQPRHAYYQGYRSAIGDAGRNQRFARYLGRSDDPQVVARIVRFQGVKAARAERITTVRALIGAGLPRPERITGRIIEALARAGLFLEHAVLTGDGAVQTYGGVLGVRSTGPRKVASGSRPAVEIIFREGHSSADILAVLHAVDPSFVAGPEATEAYRSATGDQVSVSRLNHADDAMASLVDFLIADPVQAIILFGPGIPVTVPAPERYAVGALIAHGACSVGAVASTRTPPSLIDATELIEEMVEAGREQAVLRTLLEARDRDPRWQEWIEAGIARIPEPTRSWIAALAA